MHRRRPDPAASAVASKSHPQTSCAWLGVRAGLWMLKVIKLQLPRGANLLVSKVSISVWAQAKTAPKEAREEWKRWGFGCRGIYLCPFAWVSQATSPPLTAIQILSGNFSYMRADRRGWELVPFLALTQKQSAHGAPASHPPVLRGLPSPSLGAAAWGLRGASGN